MIVKHVVHSSFQSCVPHLRATLTPPSTTVLSDSFLQEDAIIRGATSNFLGIESTISTIQDSIGSMIASSEQTINSALQMASIDPNRLWQLQQFGEKTFAAAFFIAFIQAMLVWFEYGESPTGVLIIPPGPTHGVEAPPGATPKTTIDASNKRRNKHDKFPLPKIKDDEVDNKLLSHSNDMLTHSSDMLTHSSKVFPCLGMIKTLNKYLALFIPWASNGFAYLLEGKLAILHLFSLYSLAQLYDFPNRFFTPSRKTSECLYDPKEDQVSCSATNSNDNEVPERIVVLGDSLALGIGGVNEFETGRSLGFRAENLAEPSMDEVTPPGPVFPRVFANVLAKHGQRPVHWRSAGVDGGDTKSIHEQCLGVIQEEVEQGRPPDLVILIVGVNDLKYFSSNPLMNAGPREFRTRLTDLISEIQKLSPNTKVVLPELRVFHQNSPLNVFPLTFFLDRVLGFWDSQKRLVASRFPDSMVQYLKITPQDVEEWQKKDTSEYGVESELGEDGKPDMSLISADGVHPNARCYAHWAASLAEKLVSSEQNPPTIPVVAMNIPPKRNAPRKAFIGV